MEELILEYKGYKCIAKRYENGRWGFGNGPEPNKDPESEYDFFSYADSENEAIERFPSLIEGMIKRKEYKEAEKLWKSKTDYKSVAAVFNILPEVFEKRILQGDFDKSLLVGVEGSDYVVPLYYVTKAWDNLLKGSLGSLSFMIGPEEDDDFSDETLKEFIEEEGAIRTRGEAIIQNDQMKVLWKKYFNIDIDFIEVDFTKFDMHLPPKVTWDFYYYYFDYCPDGINEWVMCQINHPEEDWAYHDVVSGLMEFTANIIKIERK